MNRKSISSIPDSELRGKRALVRVDFNVPLENSVVTDDTRIRASLPTIEYLASRGARVVLLSHLGRPKGKPEAQFSLEPVARHLATLTSRPVHFSSTTVGTQAESAVNSLRPGEILLLENTRFLDGEEKNDGGLSRALASLGDLYVNDAFGSAHRSHASTEGVAKYLRPAVAGLLMQKELDYLGKALESPARPFVGILGGSKISGKIDVLEALLPKVDRMLIGGAMACTFLRATGHKTGRSLVEAERLDMASDLRKRFGQKLLLPVDAVVAKALDDSDNVEIVGVESIPDDAAMFDIGPATILAFQREIERAKTVLWNGPMGVFEKPPFDAGTSVIATTLADATARGATTIVGGGDSAAAISAQGLENAVSHVSTGGGASLEFLEGKELPGVSALEAA